MPAQSCPPQAAIGVVDSGVGGLSALLALRERFPDESYAYIADPAHMPYGDKDDATIRDATRRLFAAAREVPLKALVIACNTMCAHGAGELAATLRVPVFDILRCGAAAAARRAAGRLGVIATAATVRSGALERAIRRRHAALEVCAVACPRLATLIESGRATRRDALRLLGVYLNRLRPATLDALLIGCTHYAFAGDAIASRLPRHALVIDPSREVVDVLERAMRRGTVPRAPRSGLAATCSFHVNGKLDAFAGAVRELAPGLPLVAMRSLRMP